MGAMKTCALIAVLLVLVAQSPSAERRALLPKLRGAKSVLHQRPPPLQGKWLTPKPDTKGKFVLIDFWQTWCGACQNIVPHLNAWQRKFDEKLVVVGLCDEDEAKVRSKMAGSQMQFSVAVDPLGSTKRDLEVHSFPHVIVIDPKGFVRWEGFPGENGHRLTEAVLEDLIKSYDGK